MTDQNSDKAVIPEAIIQQLNLGYNAQQDRLLLRVGLSDDSELLLWITYRIARELWQLLSEETHLHIAHSIPSDMPAASALEQFKRDAQTAEALKQMDFATRYQPRKETRNEGALLGIGLKLSGQTLKHLDVFCQEGVTVGINLPPPLVLALCNMLQLSMRESGWNIRAKTLASTSVNPEEPGHKNALKNKVLH